MESESCTNLEERLNSLLSHLQTESGILDRLIYKNKNQHRRCPYFQALLKVRRDLRLLQSAGLGEILNILFPIIDGKKPAQKAFLPKRQKKNIPSGKYNYQERLLGVARLLSQMAEPILKAAIQISFLFAKSFFTGFSLTVLALLARLRVLVQQTLLDVVVVFNKLSSLSQKKHAVKLTQGFIEAFREYYPSSREVLTLECAWEKDKYVLLERKNSSNTENQNEDQAALPLETSIKYETVQFFSEGLLSGLDLEDHHLSFKTKVRLEDESPAKKNQVSVDNSDAQKKENGVVSDDESICIGRRLRLDDNQPSKKPKISSHCNLGLDSGAPQLPRVPQRNSFPYNCINASGKRLREEEMVVPVSCKKIK